MSKAEGTLHPDGREFIAFRIGDEEYCVDIMAVREIRGWTRSTALPHAPEYVCGLINLRGTVLPIFDLSRRLGQGQTDPTARHVIIVVQVGTQVVGLLVDAVLDILTVASAEFHPTPEVAAGAAKQLVKGVLSVEDRMIRLLDVVRLLPSEKGEAA